MSNITCSKYGTASVADLLLNEMMALTFNKRYHFFFTYLVINKDEAFY